jgi:hypothetical protein
MTIEGKDWAQLTVRVSTGSTHGYRRWRLSAW